MDLPYQEDLPVHLLAGCFNNTSATYKFYWFLAVLGRVELGEAKILKRDLFAEMVAHAWYTVNYFKVFLVSRISYRRPLSSSERWRI